MAKQVRITIVLDQPSNVGSENVIRSILGDRAAFGGYKTFSQERVTVEEIDTEANNEGKAAVIEAERRYPCKELSDKLAAGDELTEKENRQLFKNMDRQMAFFAALRWAKDIKDPIGLEIDKINPDGSEEYRISKGGNDAKA